MVLYRVRVGLGSLARRRRGNAWDALPSNLGRVGPTGMHARQTLQGADHGYSVALLDLTTPFAPALRGMTALRADGKRSRFASAAWSASGEPVDGAPPPI